MPPTYDNVSTGTGTGATSISWTHTASGSNRCVYVGVFINTATGAEPANLAGTYDSVSMTKLDSVAIASAEVLIVFRLANPNTGAKTVSITWTGSFDSVGAALSYTGVDQSTPDGTTTADSSGGEVSSSIDVTSAAGQTVIDFIGIRQNTDGTEAPGGGQTQRATHESSYINLYGSEEAGATTTTMSWTWTTAAARYHIGVPIRPATSALAAGSMFFFPIWSDSE